MSDRNEANRFSRRTARRRDLEEIFIDGMCGVY